MTHIGGLIGGFSGFIAFIALLESKGLGSILYRNGRFTLGGLLLYLKSPFFQLYLWYPKLWIHNWILMTIIGYIMGYTVSYGTSMIEQI